MSFTPQFSLGGSGVLTPIPQTAIPAKQPFGTIGLQRCCENGRSIVINPSTGQSVCSCQMKTDSQTCMQRVPGIPESLYGSAASHMYSSAGFLGSEPSAFYRMQTSPQTECLKNPSVGSPFYFDNLLAANPYGSFYPGLDLNNVSRRKNATRETTSALKAWLFEHRKNPYPTKGEKIMLAIITRMTLTQVSTWFANARRRLKKEKKIDWDSKDGEEDIECDTSENDDNHTQENEENLSNQWYSTDEDEILKVSDISDAEEKSDSTCKQSSSDSLRKGSAYHDKRHKTFTISKLEASEQNTDQENSISLNTVSNCNNTTSMNRSRRTSTHTQESPRNSVSDGTVNNRPKIWSISEIIGSTECSSSTSITEASDVTSLKSSKETSNTASPKNKTALTSFKSVKNIEQNGNTEDDKDMT